MTVIHALAAAAIVACALHMVLSRNLVRILLGLALLATGVNLMLFAAAGSGRRQPPLIPADATVLGESADPTVQALVLTAIVIGFALTVILATIVWRGWQRTRALDARVLDAVARPDDPDDAVPDRPVGGGSPDRAGGMTDALLLLSPVGVPFVGAAVAMLLRGRPHLAERWGGLVLAATALFSVALLARALTPRPLAIAVFGGWPHGIGVGFAARLPGAVLVVVVALVMVAASIYARADIGPRRRRAGYDALMLALTGAVNGALLTTDLFNLYVWFELALVAALGLILVDRRPQQIGGTTRYAVFGMVGATAILLGIGLIYGATGTLDLAALAGILGSRPPSVATAVAAALLLSGFALKSGLAPFHVWLPGSYAAAPLSAAAVFAALMTKMGFYALMLVIAGVFGAGAAHLLPIVALLAAATMLLCALATLAQADMRRLIGYHVVAQVGYMAAGLALGTAEGLAAATFYMVHSMIVQANLFLGIGAIRRATGSWDLKRAGGMVRSDRIFAFLFAVPMLSLAGIPPLSGFWAKLFVLRGAVAAGMGWLALVALVAALLTIVSVAILWAEACWKARPAERPGRPVPAAMLGGMAVLSAATLAIGFYPQPLWLVAQMSARTLQGLGG